MGEDEYEGEIEDEELEADQQVQQLMGGRHQLDEEEEEEQEAMGEEMMEEGEEEDEGEMYEMDEEQYQ